MKRKCNKCKIQNLAIEKIGYPVFVKSNFGKSMMEGDLGKLSETA